MGDRQKQVAFLRFEAWGFDTRGWSPITRTNYRRHAVRADRWLCEHRKVSVFLARAKDFQAFLFSTSPSPRTRNQIRNALVAWCDYLVDQGFAEVNEAAGLKRIPEAPLVPKALAGEQAERIIKVAKVFGPRTEAMILLLALGGLRRGELRNLEWADISIESGWMRCKGKGRGGGKTRELPIHEDLAKALRKWRAASDEATWVFPSPVRPHLPLSFATIASTVREVGDMAGVDKLHPHLLRHTFATELLEETDNVRTVQVALGHASLNTTQIYMKVRPAQLEPMRKMDYSGGDDSGVEGGDDVTGDGVLEGMSAKSESVDGVLGLDAEPDPGEIGGGPVA